MTKICLWDDNAMTVRWLLDKFEMTMWLLYDDRSSQDKILFIWLHKKLRVSEWLWANSQDREPPSELKKAFSVELLSR